VIAPAEVSVSIVTPSLRASPWLKLCIASVADQNVLSHEHIVQDAGSDDGTLEWLSHDRRVNAFVEKDSGMYDAINRGLRRARGAVLAYLNADEQYLPGALGRAERFFQTHPEVDVVFGDVIVTGTTGEYLFHRKLQTPLLYHTWTVQLSTLSCGMFFRQRIVHEKNFWFNPSWRAGGDGEWIVRLLRAGVKMAALGEFTSVFTRTGANLGESAKAQEENRRLRETAPYWAQALRPALVAQHRLRRFLGGMYFQKPLTYEIFTSASPDRRKVFEVTSPKSRS
jgi:glycosyltransferase involved in cell wall biosynthesis